MSVKLAVKISRKNATDYSISRNQLLMPQFESLRTQPLSRYVWRQSVRIRNSARWRVIGFSQRYLELYSDTGRQMSSKYIQFRNALDIAASSLCKKKSQRTRASVSTLLQPDDEGSTQIPPIDSAFIKLPVEIYISHLLITDQRKDYIGLNCPSAPILTRVMLSYSDYLLSLRATKR